MRSRYAQLETVLYTDSLGRQLTLLEPRRFTKTTSKNVVRYSWTDSDRVDNLAQDTYGDPELFWLIMDNLKVLFAMDIPVGKTIVFPRI